MKKGFLVTLFLLMISILISCQQTIAYTVTFDTEGGSIIQSQEIKEDDFAEIPDTPLKDGYSFVEWQLNGQTYNFQQPVTSHITLVAVWEYLLFDNPVWEPVLADPSIIR
ncbi:InlB B-repeat-containing protein [Mycoplasmatota bacterium]|nr:InlB B-repeat-containing protein [Mycoplasmatota bacterium]